MKLLYDSMVRILKTLNKCGSSSFDVGERGTEKSMCIALATSYSGYIPERKDMSYIRHGLARRRLVVRFMKTVNDIRSVCSAEPSCLTEMKYTRSEYRWNLEAYAKEERQERRENQNDLTNRAGNMLPALSLYPWMSFFERNWFNENMDDLKCTCCSRVNHCKVFILEVLGC